MANHAITKVNKLGVLQFFSEQGNKQVFLLVSISQSLPYYPFLLSKVVKNM